MKKKQNEIAKFILKGLLYSGAIAIASTSPYFVPRLLPELKKYISYKLNNKNKFRRSFYYLKSKGLIKIENKKGQIYISLTIEGKKKAGIYQIDDLKIKKPIRWNKKWWILIFDIEDKHKIKREALRGKIKELGLYQLQKSVWVCPYDFQKEIKLLREFFDIKDSNMKIVVASEIENDKNVRIFFGLK